MTRPGVLDPDRDGRCCCGLMLLVVVVVVVVVVVLVLFIAWASGLRDFLGF